jgi:hypothetical protein
MGFLICDLGFVICDLGGQRFKIQNSGFKIQDSRIQDSSVSGLTSFVEEDKSQGKSKKSQGMK